MSDAMDHLADLSLDKKRELLARLLLRKSLESKSFQLSFAQERLWFLHQMDPQSAAYNCPQSVRLTGELDLSALEKSLSEIIRRHAILSTTFQFVDGRPVQVVSPVRPLLLELVDLKELPVRQQSDEAERIANEEARTPFDLAVGPVLRARILRLDEQQHVGLFTMHHIVCDGWSMGVFARELMLFYEAFAKGEASPLPELTIQYTDYCHWQRDWLQGGVLEQQLSFWRKQLSGAPHILELPADKPRPAVQTFRGAVESIVLDANLSRALKNLAHRQSATLFMALLAAFNVLLSRYTGQKDILVGTPISGRNRADIEGLIGLFLNTLPLRTDLSDNPSFRELLSRVQKMVPAALAHQDVPFEKLVDDLRLERSLDRTPLVQIMFTIQNLPKQALELKGITLSAISSETFTEKFDLTLSVSEKAKQLLVNLRYNTDLFNKPTIARMLGHFETLLKGFVSNPDNPVAAVTFISEVERHQLLNEWNETGAYYPNDKCAHELFEAQAANTPHEIAVVFENEQLTYYELNARANQLACYLRTLGAGPEELVAICLDRSIDLVVSLLAVFKTGAAYVPLDPSYPRERLTFILEETLAPVIVTQERLLEGLPQRARAVCIDTQWEIIARESHENVGKVVSPDNLAYVIYTSGSTGRPKGVMIQHSSLVNHVYAASVKYALTPSDRVLQFASMSFDTSVEEIFPALTCGARLVLRTDAMLTSAFLFLRTCRDWGVTVLSLPTAYWHDLTGRATAEDWASVPQLRLVVIGGERALPDRLTRWQQNAGGRVRLVNAYGPTETTIGALMCEVSQRPAQTEELAEVPIGSPIANVRAYILDERLQPAPVGVYGELCIGGVALGRGYLNCPDQTAERFIPDPFCTQFGERIYKTGDIVRYKMEGQIEYRGRLDDQVKIRGFRIELGEIESALSQHSEVREAVATVKELAPGDKRLVVYFTPCLESVERDDGLLRHDGAKIRKDNRAAILEKDLRAHLNGRLPGYMIPSAFVMLDAFPLTPNGKVDRRALSARNDGVFRESTDAPCTAAEHSLAGIWTQMLGLEQVGRHENFFQLGGDSILAIQIVAKANQAGFGLAPKDIFQHQTIAELAAVAGAVPLVQVEQDCVAGAVPLTPIQRWFFEQDIVHSDYWNQSVLLESQEPLNPQLVDMVVQKLIEHHDGLRLRFRQGESGWEQLNLAREASSQFSQVDLSRVQQSDLSMLIEQAAAQAQTSLNLKVGPMLRVLLFEAPDQQGGRLLIAIHHLCVDGVSWRILLEDLRIGYQQASSHQPIEFAAKTASYKQWAEHLSSYAQTEQARREAGYWLKMAEQSVKPMPVDKEGGSNTEASAEVVRVKLSQQETRQLLQEVPRVYHTQIDEVLLTGLALAYRKWSGSNRMKLDLEGHGREEIAGWVDVSRTVGWFTSVYPVVLEVGDKQTEDKEDVGEDLKTVKEQIRGIANKGIGYGVLRYMADDEAISKKLSEGARAEMIFNYLGQIDQVLPERSTFRSAKQSAGPTRDSGEQRSHLLYINGSIFGGQLRMSWTYSKNIYHQATIEAFADYFLESLKAIITHCRSVESAQHTPSDFPMVKINQQQLDTIIARIRKTDKAPKTI